MADLYKNLGTVEPDDLIIGTIPPVDYRGRTIRKLGTAGTIKRGTIMAKSSVDGKLVMLGSNAAVTNGEQKFNGDGTTKVFVVTAKPASLTNVKVGSADSSDWTYDASTGKITFGTAPAAGTNNVIASYVASSEELTPDCIIADEVEVGTTDDVAVAVYVAGNFNFNKCIVAEGYTVTDADFDELRRKNIMFRKALAY